MRLLKHLYCSNQYVGPTHTHTHTHTLPDMPDIPDHWTAHRYQCCLCTPIFPTFKIMLCHSPLLKSCCHSPLFKIMLPLAPFQNGAHKSTFEMCFSPGT